MTLIWQRLRELLCAPASRGPATGRCAVCQKPIPRRTGPLCACCTAIFAPPGPLT